jgi:antitoxin HicB
MDKNYEYYMSLKYPFTVYQDDDGSWFLKYPDLPGCMTCAATLQEVIEMGEDAKAGWIELALEDKRDIPEPRSEESYSGVFKLRIPKSLHRDLSLEAAKQQTSLNQYCLLLLAKNNELSKYERHKRVGNKTRIPSRTTKASCAKATCKVKSKI